jgi:hypothetical protein
MSTVKNTSIYGAASSPEEASSMSTSRHLGNQFNTTTSAYGDSHSPKHSNWTMDSPKGKHRKSKADSKKRNGSHNRFYQPEHAKGASGYTGKHAKTIEYS